MLQSTILLAIVAWFFACTQVDIYAPIGPKGEKGDKGDKGQSTYELWKEKVAQGLLDWNKNETSESDFFKFLKGKDGQDGKSAYDQWKEYIASGDVDDPHDSSQKWDSKKNAVRDFWDFLMGRPGADGKTPYIKNGNWWIGDTDLGTPVRGEDGHTPIITIGDNGNWWIDGKDTNKPARGEKGDKGDQGDRGEKGDKGDQGDRGEKGDKGDQGDRGEKGDKGDQGDRGEKGDKGDRGEKGDKGDQGDRGEKGEKGDRGEKGNQGDNGSTGSNGKTVYELWVEEVTKNCGKSTRVMDPHNPTQPWDCNKISFNDFMDYLRGKDGEDGLTPGAIVKGKYNVLPQYYNVTLGEYVSS